MRVSQRLVINQPPRSKIWVGCSFVALRIGVLKEGVLSNIPAV